MIFFFSSRRRHTRCSRDWSSDVCSSDLPRGISDANYTRYKDSVLDELYVKQGRAIDLEERKKYVREFEKRLLDEEAHTMYTLQWHRIIPHNSRVKGWTVTPSHYLNNQLDTVWLAEGSADGDFAPPPAE